MEIINIHRKINCILMQLLMCSLNSLGQSNSLATCVDFSNEVNQIKEYNEKFEMVLMKSFEEDYIIRFIAKPTFEPEYAFQIRKTDNANFEIAAVLFRENLWNNQGTDPVVDVRKRTINKDLVLMIDTLFKAFTNSVSSTSTLGIGLDGTSYIFKRKARDGVKCGETWSPNENSTLGKLVSLCNVLTEYAKNEAVKPEKVQESLNKLNAIVK